MPEATLPAYAHPGDAGLDLSAAVEVVLEPGQARLIATGISVELPPGTEAQIRPRSGLALRHSVTVLNTPGTIDEGYRGEVGVVLINHGTRSVKVERGMRIAQLVVAARLEVEVREVEALSKADRGAAGFGSTGGFEVERAPAMEPRVSPRERP